MTDRYSELTWEIIRAARLIVTWAEKLEHMNPGVSGEGDS